VQPPTLTTARLILRPFSPADADELQQRIDDFDVARNTLRVPHPYTLAHATEWIGSLAASESEIVFAITPREGGAIAGAVGIVIQRDDAVGEIGYWIAREFRGRGFATEATIRAITYGFDELELNRIEAEHFSRNPASGRVMQKCGMRHEGTLRQRHRRWGEFVDCEMYAILKDER
jgi:RimJ/RimL family protein N-acetyltransferase